MNKNMTELFEILNKMKLADQVHFRDSNQVVFYHWNRGMTDLVPSLTLQRGKIEKFHYNRTIMPRVYIMANYEFINDFTEEHKFTRDKRAKN